MKTMTKITYAAFALFALAYLALSPTVQADQIILNYQNIIGGSGCYSPGTDTDWNSPTNLVSAFGVTDLQLASSIFEGVGGVGYWLGKDGDFQEYFVVDPGAVYNLGSVKLFNTHNGPESNRATGHFQIYVSNQVLLGVPRENGMGGYDLFPETLAIEGTLFPVLGDPI